MGFNFKARTATYSTSIEHDGKRQTLLKWLNDNPVLLYRIIRDRKIRVNRTVYLDIRKRVNECLPSATNDLV